MGALLGKQNRLPEGDGTEEAPCMPPCLPYRTILNDRPVAVEDVAVWKAGARYTVRSGVIQFPQAPRAIHATTRGPPVLPLRAIPPGPVTAQTGGGARCE